MNAYQSKNQALVKISGFTMGEIGLASRLRQNLYYIDIDIYTIIGQSLVNICKGLEPRKCRSMNARSRPFFPNDGP